MTAAPRPPRLTIRVRLTLLYGATFAAALTAALGAIYVIMSELVTPAVAARPTVPLGSPSPMPAQPLRDAPQPLDSLLRISGLVLVMCSLGGVAIGWIVAGRMLAPIRRVTTTAARIAAGHLHERVALPGPDDEVKELADTFDDMLSRLQSAFDGHRNFAANASHELLTPLATSQALIDVAAATPSDCDVPTLLADLTEVNVRSEQIVGALLDLARAERGIGSPRTVDLADFVRDAIAMTLDEASRRDVSVLSRLDNALVIGDPILLRQLATNLMTNAIRHNNPGGEVTVTVATDRGHAVMTVSNTGPRVAPDQVARLFEPFARLGGRARHKDGDAQNGGHGLGLAIVQAVTTAHHGTLAVTANPTGGLTIDISLPLAVDTADFDRRATR
ncbi:HAMP domain-containing sensor histidine kinase [Actinoallomurus sp. NPDC050550]|uniref:sensor histidine kinase n=1 Tax=Actinoallomurus sp. NPDC050550 TaxID=3154937 RepID=UPI0033D4E58C